MPQSPSTTIVSTNADGTILDVVHVVPASVAEVYAAWTEAALLEQWLADGIHTDVRVGGSYRLESPAADGIHLVIGEYREVVPNERLVMTWQYQGPEGSAEAGPSTIGLWTVTLREIGERQTELRLREEPLEDLTISEKAWTEAMGFLDELFVPPIADPVDRPSA